MLLHCLESKSMVADMMGNGQALCADPCAAFVEAALHNEFEVGSQQSKLLCAQSNKDEFCFEQFRNVIELDWFSFSFNSLEDGLLVGVKESRSRELLALCFAALRCCS